MELTLEITKSIDPELRVGDVRKLEESEDVMLRFGRARGNDVRMTQDNKSISKDHARIYFDGGNFCLADTSTNGTGINDVVLHDGYRVLSDGDRIAIGQYEFQVLLDEDLHIDPGPETDDLLSVMHAGLDGLSKSPFGPELHTSGFDAADPLRSGGELPQGNSELTLTPHPDPVPPVGHGQKKSEPAVQATTRQDEWVKTVMVPPHAGSPLHPPLEPLASGPALRDDAALWEAFLRGAQVNAAEFPSSHDMDAHFEALGRMFRAFVEGTIKLMRARAELRNDFGLENTVYGAEENNPLKLSTNAMAALGRLLQGKVEMGYMKPEEAISDAMEALAIHEYAVIEASTSGLDVLFKPLHPERFERDQSARKFTLPIGREKRAWRLYREVFDRFIQDREFVDTYCRHFADTYDDVVNARGPGESAAETAANRARSGRRARRR